MWAEMMDAGLWTRIGFAMFSGILIGVERQVRGKPVGIRTSTLICLGTVLFVYLGQMIEPIEDSSRVLAQVITGVGFLGAGVIMNKDGLVSGVTSASIIWLLAGVGAAFGLGYYGIGLVITFVALFVLICVQYLEGAFHWMRRGVHKTFIDK